jgi:hypothetical protein
MPSINIASCAGDRVAFVPHHPRPHEPALIDSLGEETQPVAVPEQDLDDPRPLAPEGEQMTRERVLLQRVPLDRRAPLLSYQRADQSRD